MVAGGYMVGFATLIATAGGGTIAGVLVVRRRLDHLRGSARLAALGLTVTAALVAVHLLPGALGLLYPGVVATCALLVAGACALLPYAPGGAGDDGARAPDDPPLSQVLALVAAGAVVVACVASLRLTGDRVPVAIDTLSFHLPDVARWVQQHGFWHIAQFTPDLAPGNYPNNGDVLSLLAVLPFHDLALARFVFVPWLALTGLGVYALGRELGAARASAVVFAAAAVALPAVATSTLRFVDPDAVLYATFSAGLLFLVRHRRTGEPADAALAGLGLGLALGTKWYGVSAFAVVGALWACGLLLRRVPPRRIVGDGRLIAGIALTAGGFWLLRNLVLSGNPLFPLKVAAGGVTIFDAPPDVVRARGGFTLAHYAGDGSVLRTYVWPAFEASFGYAPLVLGAGTLAAAWLGRARRAVPWLAFVAVCLAIAYAVTPYSAQGPAGRPVGIIANARYGVPALLVAAALCAVAAARLGRARPLAEALGALLALDGLRRAFDIPAHTAVTTLVALVAAGAAALVLRALAGRALRPAPVLAAGMLLVAFAGARHLDRHVDETAWHQDAVLAWVRVHAADGHRVGLAGRWPNTGVAPPLPAFGPTLGNQVVYIGPFQRHMLREYRTGARFLARVRSEHVDLLLIGRGYPVPVDEPREERWARAAGMRLLARSARLVLYAA